MAQLDKKATEAARRRRGTQVQVQPKRPWGFLIGSGLLGLALVGVVAYAVTNQGSGFKDPLKTADASIQGVVLAPSKALTRNHKEGVLSYAQHPPNSGDHNPLWENCGVYDKPVPDENAVHSLEHGAVWITYQPNLPAAQVDTLRSYAAGQSYVLMSPYPGQKAPIDLSAWGRRLSVDSASDPRIQKFIAAYAAGPQTPEPGAACSGGTSATGSAPPSSNGAGMPQSSPAA